LPMCFTVVGPSAVDDICSHCSVHQPVEPSYLQWFQNFLFFIHLLLPVIHSPCLCPLLPWMYGLLKWNSFDSHSKTCAEIFKLVFYLRSFSFMILICMVNIFFLESSKENNSPVRFQWSLNHEISKVQNNKL
jgi:hypothetical protein